MQTFNFGIDEKGKIWPGFSTAVCLTENGLYMRMNDKGKVITGITAYNKITELEKKYKDNNEKYQSEIKEYFIGKTVVAQYGNYRYYRIGDVLMDKNVNNTSINYTDAEGKTSTITLKNYYQTQYRISIKNDDQPLFVDEKSAKDDESKKRYLIPELLYLTGIGELEEKEKAPIIAKSKIHPVIKMKKIEKGFTYFTQNKQKKIKRKNKVLDLPSPNEVRKEWGITFGDKFKEVEARTLNIPLLEFKDLMTEKPQMINGRFRLKRDVKPIHFDNSNCVLITFNDIVNLAKNDCDQLNKASNEFGIKFKMPELITLKSTNKEELLDELKQVKLYSVKKMIIVVVDVKTKDLYPFIKDYLYTVVGIASQFMLHDESQNKGGSPKQNMSYYSSVLNQMVVKAKGELFRIHFCNEVETGPSMIVGLDSYKTKEGNKYILSASYNRTFNRYYTDFAIAKNTSEDNTLCELFRNCLNYFFKINGNHYPKYIIIYRQIRNDSENRKILKSEVAKLKDFMSGDEDKIPFKKGYNPRLTFFTVNQKPDLQFYENSPNGYKNIPMGTVIDQDVIYPDCFEFYMQCSSFDRGCIPPVHYLCIYNDNDDLTFNDYEDITYKQSYYYWNWPGPVRIPTALKNVEVAHSFCQKNIVHEIKENLKNSPYFI